MRLSHYLTNMLFKPFSPSSYITSWPTLSNMFFEVMQKRRKKNQILPQKSLMLLPHYFLRLVSIHPPNNSARPELPRFAQSRIGNLI